MVVTIPRFRGAVGIARCVLGMRALTKSLEVGADMEGEHDFYDCWEEVKGEAKDISCKTCDNSLFDIVEYYFLEAVDGADSRDTLHNILRIMSDVGRDGPDRLSIIAEELSQWASAEQVSGWQKEGLL